MKTTTEGLKKGDKVQYSNMGIATITAIHSETRLSLRYEGPQFFHNAQRVHVRTVRDI